MKILVTGAAGFIGAHTCRQLLDMDMDIIGIDNINDYYDISLKEARLDWIAEHENAARFSSLKWILRIVSQWKCYLNNINSIALFT